ncbi:MAG: isochorismatase family protein [Rhodomicrobium sp.]
MLTMRAETSTLLVIDFQARLMPAIANAEEVVANARRLLAAAALFNIPILFTEQNAQGLGSTIEDLSAPPGAIAHKVTFDACRSPGFLERLGNRPDVTVAGCEAHVCVLQTVLGLLDAGRRVFLVRDAVGARTSESKETAIRRMERHGAEIVTTEMAVFEWLETSENAHFRGALSLVK